MPVQHNFETLKRSQETKDKFRSKKTINLRFFFIQLKFYLFN